MRVRGRQIKRASEEESSIIMPGSDGRHEIIGSAFNSQIIQASIILTMTIIIIKIIIIAIIRNNNM